MTTERTSSLVGMLVCMLLGLAPAQEVRAQPAGGYQQSCRNTSVQGNVLRSSCRDGGGNFRSTMLTDFAQCVGYIFNDDGTLRCSRSAPQHGHRKGQRQGNPSAQLR